MPPRHVHLDDVGTRQSNRVRENRSCMAMTAVYDPLTVEDALCGPSSDQRKKAMAEEHRSLMENKTWNVVNLPPNRKAINCKWVFKTKRDSDGMVQKYKARLVIKGCARKKGIDYEETFAPVVRYGSIRYLIALASKFNLEINQMDAVTAFLQGDLDQEIFMTQPEYLGDGTNKVCRLNKSLYGLKQASRVWNQKLDAALTSFGLSSSKADS